MALPRPSTAHTAPRPLRFRLCVLAALVAAGACTAETPPPRGAAAPPTGHPPRAPTPPPPSPTAEPQPAASAPEAPACEPLKTAGFDRPQHDSVGLGDIPIQWGDRLAAFYESLARLERGGLKEPLRIGVHGDSNLTKDALTGEMRRVLQTRYGDAGHGFLAAVRAWGWYRHQDVQQSNDAWWRVLAISAPRSPDLGYGIGGIAAVCRSPGGRTWFATSDEGDPFGHDVSRIGVYYRKQPEGGSFEVQIDGSRSDEIATSGDSVSAVQKIYEVKDGPHRIDLLTTTGGEVRILGVSFERDRPGIIVDSFGVGGSYFQALTLMDNELNAQMAKQRRHSLVIYWLGANPHFAKQYSRDVKLVVDARRKADPDLPILVISPPDTASQGRDSPSDPVSMTIAQHLRDAAEQTGCAYWPMRDAQGGEGAGGRFLKNGLAVDKQHLSQDGSNLMAHLLLHEIWKDYRRYLEAHPRAGCDDAAPAR